VESLLQTENLAKEYQGRQVVNRVSIHVNAG
jgi:ABC-type lipopolysaccharide export system ATPase subunit